MKLLVTGGLGFIDSNFIRYMLNKYPKIEITSVNNAYITTNNMKFRVLKGFWSDAGTFDSLFKASKWLKEHS